MLSERLFILKISMTLEKKIWLCSLIFVFDSRILTSDFPYCILGLFRVLGVVYTLFASCKEQFNC